MSDAALPRKPDETTLRKAAGVLFLMGFGMLFLILKMERLSEFQFKLGCSIWLFWGARLLVPGLPAFVRRAFWSVSLAWHCYWLFLTGPLLLLHPMGWAVLLHCVVAILVSKEGMQYDWPRPLA